jgi:hypothetical protein
VNSVYQPSHGRSPLSAIYKRSIRMRIGWMGAYLVAVLTLACSTYVLNMVMFGYIHTYCSIFVYRIKGTNMQGKSGCNQLSF